MLISAGTRNASIIFNCESESKLPFPLFVIYDNVIEKSSKMCPPNTIKYPNSKLTCNT